MNRQVAAVGFASSCAIVLMWLLGFYQPELMAAAPTGLESAFTGIIGTAVAWLTRDKPLLPPPPDPPPPA